MAVAKRYLLRDHSDDFILYPHRTSRRHWEGLQDIFSYQILGPVAALLSTITRPSASQKQAKG